MSWSSGPAPQAAEAGLFKKVKRKSKKVGRSVKKEGEKAVKKGRKVAVSSTGAVSKILKKGVSVTGKELRTGVKRAIDGLDRLGRKLGKLLTQGVIGEFKKLYRAYIRDYVRITKALYAGQSKLLPAVTDVGLYLAEGNFKKASEKAGRLLKNKGLKAAIGHAKRSGFKSLVVLADGSVGSHNVSAGGGVGIVIPFSKSDKIRIFAAGSGSLTTDSTANAGIGISVGFLRGKSSNIKGATVDVAGAADCNSSGSVACTVVLSWVAPSVSPKVPFVKAKLKPIAFMFGLSTGVGGAPASLSLGATNAWILQSVKR